MRWLLQNECACVPLNAAGVTKVGFTLCSVTISAVMDKKCLFFNIPGITCFHIPGAQTLFRRENKLKNIQPLFPFCEPAILKTSVNDRANKFPA